MPTAEQLESRAQLAEFMERAGRPIRALAGKVKSAWFSRPDDELKGWIERGRAINEIQDSIGYRLILDTTDREIEWAREQLELGKLDERDLRGYLKGLRFLKEFILTVNKNADIATGVLAGRDREIGRNTTTFLSNATVRN